MSAKRFSEVQVTALQVCRAYESHFGQPIPEGKTCTEIARLLKEDMGEAAAVELVLAQSNEFNAEV